MKNTAGKCAIETIIENAGRKFPSPNLAENAVVHCDICGQDFAPQGIQEGGETKLFIRVIGQGLRERSKCQSPLAGATIHIDQTVALAEAIRR